MRHYAQMVLGMTGNTPWDRFIHIMAPVLAAIFNALIPFVWSQIFLWTTVFWGISFVLAMIRIVRTDEDFNRGKAVRSVGKLFTWWTVLFVAFGMRQIGLWAIAAAAAILETAILLTEGATVLKNLGLLWPESPTGALLARLAGKVSERVTKGEEKEEDGN